MRIADDIASNQEEFRSICRAYKVKYLYAFGSATDDRFVPETSDIDLLVYLDNPDPIARGESLISIWDEFEKFFGRNVDLLTEQSIHNPYLKKSIDSSKILIYDGTREEILV